MSQRADDLTPTYHRRNAQALRDQAALEPDETKRAELLGLANQYDQVAIGLEFLESRKALPRISLARDSES
jgi:hypothetical protein